MQISDRVEYIISNPKTLNLFSNLRAKAGLFSAEKGNPSPYVVVSARGLEEDVNKVVYLDTPYIYFNTSAEVYVNKNACGYEIVNEISVDRNIMTEVYNILRINSGKEFNNSIEFYYKNVTDYNIYQFIFGVEVFLELGIFKIKNGLFTHNETVKNALTNSALYSKMVVLKGRYV